MNRPEESDPLFPQMYAEPAVDAAGASKLKRAPAFRQGLHRAHAGFVAFALAGVAALTLSFPRLADKQRLDALADLALLSGELDVAALRRQLAVKAERELAFDLDRVARAVALPELTAKQGAGPEAQLQTAEVPALATLGALASIAQLGAKFPVRGPHVEALAASLRWRLTRQRETRPLVLTDLRLSHAVGLRAVDTEAVVEPARVEALQALAAYNESYEHYTQLRDRCDELEKRGLSKKDMLPTVQERVSAYEVLVENKALMQRASRTYSQRAARALRRDALLPDEAGGGTLVVATLQADGEKPLELKIPLARPARVALAPPFQGPLALTRLQVNPLWPEIRGLDALGATQQLEGKVSFHLRSTEIAGVRISGVAVLQALPLVMLLFLWMLTRGCRAATRAYSAFGSNQGIRLPTPGTGNTGLDCALLLTLPLTVCSLVCLALWRVDAAPWIAAALSVPLLLQSLAASRMWKELHRLLDTARHRSLLQPLPERPVVRARLTGTGR